MLHTGLVHPFMNELVPRTVELGVKLLLEHSDHVVYDGNEFSGFFTTFPEPTLAIHLEGRNAESVMLHESQHMEQWHEGCKAWKEAFVASGIGAEDLLFLWIDKKLEFTRPQLRRMCQLAVNLELDCEKRTVKLIRRLRREGKTEIVVKEYIQKANAYVMFWRMVAKTRKWYKIGKLPYELPEVYGEFPTTFDMNYTRLPSKYEQLYRQHCL